MDTRHEKKELDEEKASREDASEVQVEEIFYVDPKAESRYVAYHTLSHVSLNVL